MGRKALSRCQFLRGPVGPPEDGCVPSLPLPGVGVPASSGPPRATRWPFPSKERAMSLAPTLEAFPPDPACTQAVAVPTPAPARRGTLANEPAMRHAGRRRVELHYELLGDAALPAVLVAGGISAGRHMAASDAFPSSGWWEAQVGGGRALDPARHCLVAVDWLGADGALDAPIDPADQ